MTEKISSSLRLKLERTLAIFDLEATGTSPRADRIVELSVVRIHPDGSRDTHTYRINPEMPIPPESTRIHGITDAAVAQCQTFRQLAPAIERLFEGCDLGGYNVLRFDIPMLIEEFLRVDRRFDVENRRVIDAQRIYHRREPRDLTAALAFYCNEKHLDAHGAEGDTLATVRVLEAQLQQYKDLPDDVALLSEYCDPRDASWVDRQGRLKWLDGYVALNFGKKKNVRLSDIIRDDPGFIKWMLRNDFSRDLKDILENALAGKWPVPPTEQSKEI